MPAHSPFDAPMTMPMSGGDDQEEPESALPPCRRRPGYPNEAAPEPGDAADEAPTM
jgi:hypothetical protein